jgi:hypothetical protein
MRLAATPRHADDEDEAAMVGKGRDHLRRGRPPPAHRNVHIRRPHT